MKQDYQFLIIGGGPSGSALAALLAKLRFQVCLIEKKSFPREVLCGEFLSSEVIDFINEQGLYDRFLDLHPALIKSLRLINSNGREIFSHLNFNAYGLKRSEFDNLLLENAKAKGADVIIPAEVKSVLKQKDKYVVNIKGAEDEYEIISSQIIAAYGKQNPLDKYFNRSFSSAKTGYTGIKIHLDKKYFKHPPEGEIQIYLSDNIYCGLNQVNDDKYTICFLTNISGNRLNPKDHLLSLMERNKKFRELFISGTEDVIQEEKIYGTGNIYFGVKEKYKYGIYFTGDASGMIAPLSGDGIGMAIESAGLISNHFRKFPMVPDPADYLYKWNRSFSLRIKLSKLIQGVLLNNITRSFAISAASKFPGILPYMISKTRSAKARF